MNEELKEQTIKARVDELMADGAECDPWTHDHVLEAIGQTESILFTCAVSVAHQLPNNPISENALVQQTLKTVFDYWRGQAEYMANAEFDSRRRDCEED
jgi:hypothetical protein